MLESHRVGAKVLLSIATVLGCAAAIGWVGVPVASASCVALYNEQGIDYRGSGTDNGTHSFIQGGGMHANTCGDAWATVSIQELVPGPYQSAFLQTGYHTQTSTDLDDCGLALPPDAVYEYQIHSDLGNYHCIPYANLGTGGTQEGDLFAVVKQTSGWQAFFNGVAESPGNLALGFSSGYSVARGEVNHTSNSPEPDFYETWGPSGTTNWQYKAGTGTYHDVGSGATQLAGDTYDGDTNDWNNGPPPSPFFIQWIG